MTTRATPEREGGGGGVKECALYTELLRGIETPCGDSVVPAEELGSETTQHVFISVEGGRRKKKKADDTKVAL